MQEPSDRQRDAGDAEQSRDQGDEQDQRHHGEKQQRETKQRDRRQGQQDHHQTRAECDLCAVAAFEALDGVACARWKGDQSGEGEDDQTGAVREKRAQRLVGTKRAEAVEGRREDEVFRDTAAVEPQGHVLTGLAVPLDRCRSDPERYHRMKAASAPSGSTGGGGELSALSLKGSDMAWSCCRRQSAQPARCWRTANASRASSRVRSPSTYGSSEDAHARAREGGSVGHRDASNSSASARELRSWARARWRRDLTAGTERLSVRLSCSSERSA